MAGHGASAPTPYIMLYMVSYMSQVIFPLTIGVAIGQTMVVTERFSFITDQQLAESGSHTK